MTNKHNDIKTLKNALCIKVEVVRPTGLIIYDNETVFVWWSGAERREWRRGCAFSQRQLNQFNEFITRNICEGAIKTEEL